MTDLHRALDDLRIGVLRIGVNVAEAKRVMTDRWAVALACVNTTHLAYAVYPVTGDPGYPSSDP